MRQSAMWPVRCLPTTCHAAHRAQSLLLSSDVSFARIRPLPYTHPPADYWLNILDTQGEDLADDDLIDYLSENRSLSR